MDGQKPASYFEVASSSVGKYAFFSGLFGALLFSETPDARLLSYVDVMVGGVSWAISMIVALRRSMKNERLKMAHAEALAFIGQGETQHMGERSSNR